MCCLPREFIYLLEISPFSNQFIDWLEKADISEGLLFCLHVLSMLHLHTSLKTGKFSKMKGVGGLYFRGSNLAKDSVRKTNSYLWVSELLLFLKSVISA